VETLKFLLDKHSVFPKQLDFIIKLSQLIKYSVFMVLIDSAQMNDGVPTVLRKYGITLPNIPQSEQMGYEHCSQK
jgi:hypothetical protein